MSDKKLVWDLPLRLFHWLFGISIIAAWISIELGREQIHMYLGYFILGLLTFRLIWGIIGTRHALFWQFIPSPKKLFAYLPGLFKRDSAESVGHNPIGSLMVILMFVLVGTQAITGLFTQGEIWAGPYSSAVEKSTSKDLEAIHHTLFDYILIAIGIHVFAAFFYLFYKKQNLIWPMITGKKKSEVVPAGEGIPHSRLWIALALLAVVSGFIYWLAFVAPPPVVYDYYY